MIPQQFAAQRKRSKVYEIAFSQWLQQRGYYILPAYDYSGWQDAKAPKLQCGTAGLVMPDLLACKDGKMQWFEVKLKDRADLHRKSGALCTGFAYRHYCDYLEVAYITGIPIWMVFIHEQENVVLTCEIGDCFTKLNHIYVGDKMDKCGGTIFLRYHELTYVMPTTFLKGRERAA